jgi:hypothetical protein
MILSPERNLMDLQTIAITIVGSAVVNTIVSAITNHFQGDDVAKSAKGGVAGGLAGGVTAACLSYFLGVNL